MFDRIYYNRDNSCRGRDEQPSDSTSRLQRLGEVLTEYLNQQLEPRRGQWQLVQQLWDDVIPDHIAEHCRPMDFTDGRLVVVVDGPGYAHEIRLLTKDIIEQARRTLPRLKIKKVVTVLNNNS